MRTWIDYDKVCIVILSLLKTKKRLQKKKMYQISFHYEFISLINEDNFFFLSLA